MMQRKLPKKAVRSALLRLQQLGPGDYWHDILVPYVLLGEPATKMQRVHLLKLFRSRGIIKKLDNNGIFSRWRLRTVTDEDFEF